MATSLPLRIRVNAARLFSALVHRPRLGRLGHRSFIDRPRMLVGAANISIGDRTSIRYGARIEAQPRFAHRRPSLVIGSDTNIEQNVHIMCQSRISIGDRVSITGHCALVDVTHPFTSGDGKIGDRILDEDSFIEIADDVFIGFGTVVLPNVRIGAGSVIGANSVVAHDIPPGSVAAGVPAKVLRTIATSEPPVGDER